MAPPKAKKARTLKESPAEGSGPRNDHLRDRWLLAEVSAYYPEREPATGCLCRTTSPLPGRLHGTSEHYRFHDTSLPAVVSGLWASRDSEPWRNVRVRFRYDGYDVGGRMLAVDVKPVSEKEETKIKNEPVQAEERGEQATRVKAEPVSVEETKAERRKSAAKEQETKIKAEPVDDEAQAEAQPADDEGRGKAWKKALKRAARFHALAVEQQSERAQEMQDKACMGGELALAELCCALSPPCLLADVREKHAERDLVQVAMREALTGVLGVTDGKSLAATSLLRDGLIHVQQHIEDCEKKTGTAVAKAADHGKSWKKLSKAISKLLVADLFAEGT